MSRPQPTTRDTETPTGTLLRLVAQDVSGTPLADVWGQLSDGIQDAAQQAVNLSALMNHPDNWEHWPSEAPDAPHEFLAEYAAHLKEQGAHLPSAPPSPGTTFLTVRAHIPAELLVSEREEQEERAGEANAHECSLSLGAVSLRVAGRHCVISGIHSHQHARLEAYIPWIEDVLRHGATTSLFLEERDDRDGSENVYVAALLNLPGCPHGRLGVCEHISHSYFDEPHDQANDQTFSQHWTPVEALAVLEMGPSFWTHLHLFEPDAPLLSSQEEAEAPAPLLN